jgi:RecA/RadA recombinase
MPDQRQVIEELRERIRRIERRPVRSDHVVPSGWPAVDGLLGGGFPRGAITELCGPPGSGKTALALAALARTTETGSLAAFVDGRGELYAPAALALGVDLERLLVVRPPVVAVRVAGRAHEQVPACVREALWAAEALLASGAFAAVAVDVPVAAGARAGAGGASAEAMLRRLQSAAEKGNTAALWLAEPGSCRVPARVRLEVAGGASRAAVRRAAGVERGHAA